jgi:FAD/FMN-containing dehydrogenase
VAPEDAGYDTARRVRNGRIDRRPALIAYCANEADVVSAVRFARERELLAAVRSGGHSCAGTAICDGGLVIDLSLMKAIEMDVPGGTVRAQAGVLWAELDRATQASGLAVPGGTDSEVGIAGLTLGGGNGWLMGLYGATCDNLLAADVVGRPLGFGERRRECRFILGVARRRRKFRDRDLVPLSHSPCWSDGHRRRGLVCV